MQQLVRRTSLYASGNSAQRQGSSLVNDKVPKILTNVIRNSVSNKQKKSNLTYFVNGIKGLLRNQNCSICLNPISNKPYSIASCNHFYCEECLGHYIKYKIDSMEQITCPNEQCHLKLGFNCQIFKSMPQNYKNKYYKQQIWRLNMKNSDYRMCFKQECEGLINLNKIPPECQQCHFQICKECMMKYHTGPCDQNFQLNFKQWKRCPKCKIFIQKTLGCNHMVCQCKFQFCYVCLSPWAQSHNQCLQQGDRLLIKAQPSSCRSKIIAFLMIICFPILLCIGLALAALVLAISTIIIGLIDSLNSICYQILDHHKCCWCICIFITPVICIIRGLIVMFVFLIGLGTILISDIGKLFFIFALDFIKFNNFFFSLNYICFYQNDKSILQLFVKNNDAKNFQKTMQNILINF